jgi:predicted RNA-binding protein YlxR (DUF448 family)
MLLRVVVVSDHAGQGLVPDPYRRRPGRGAHLHHDLACLEQAVKRRAFVKALRVTGVLDTGALTAYLTQYENEQREQPTVERTTRTQQGRTTRHEHTMNSPKK